MAASWRHILQKASLSVELNERTSGDARHQPIDRRTSPWTSPEPNMVESGDLLALELERISSVPTRAGLNRQKNMQRAEGASNLYRSHISKASIPPAPGLQRPQHNPHKNNAWRHIAAISFSGAIISLTGYTFLNQGGDAREMSGQMPSSPEVSGPEKDNLKPVSGAISVATAALPNQWSGAKLPYDKWSEPPASHIIESPVTTNPVISSPVTNNPAPAVEENTKQSLAPAQEENNTAAVPAKTVVNTLSRATEQVLLERASTQLNRGDIAGARIIYEMIAQYGSPQGAFGLAETYDPVVLARHMIRGLKPDPHLARVWYEKAAELGSGDASQRLKGLK
jgi:hypothetical protein